MVGLAVILKLLLGKFYLFVFSMFVLFSQFSHLIVVSREYVNLNLFLRFYLLVELFLLQNVVPYQKTCLLTPQIGVLFLLTIF